MLYCSTVVLPPSENKCSFSFFSRENSGILPKRHGIRIPCDEHYSLMYNIISKPSSLNNQKSVFISCILTIFSFHWNSTGYGPPSTPTTVCVASWKMEENKTCLKWKETHHFTSAFKGQKRPFWTAFIAGSHNVYWRTWRVPAPAPKIQRLVSCCCLFDATSQLHTCDCYFKQSHLYQLKH